MVMEEEEAMAMVSNGLKIKIATSNVNGNGVSNSEILDKSVESSAYNSPLVSPPSSAFVSALQSPYISPRAQPPSPPPQAAAPALLSYQSEDIPSSSYTPPSDPYEFSDDPPDQNLKFITATTTDLAPPRISFSFPVPRVSFSKVSVSPAIPNAKLRSCDVFVGFHGHNNNPNLVRFCKWLKSELEVQGIACFVADRAKYADSQSHEIADRVICSVSYGVVVVTASCLLNYLTLEEIRFFSQKKNLVPIFFDTGPAEIADLANRNSVDRECRDAIDRLVKSHEFKLEAENGSWRSCVSRAANILRAKLGRKNGIDVVNEFDELPFPRNRSFLGRDKEIAEIETMFFGLEQDQAQARSGETSTGQSESSDRESTMEVLGRKRVNNPNPNPKHKKSKPGFCSVICVNGVAGIGKTELALEFAYRFRERYKMVLWVGGEARYLRQNILNLSIRLGVDVSADSEKERGRIRSFEEQEMEAFKRVKREMFRDMPYLLVIDNLETEKEWWEGKDLHDLIPRNTGATHVIITTRLSKVMNFDAIHVPPLPLNEAMLLITAGTKNVKELEMEFVREFDEKLGRLTFGLMLVGSLLSELAISPSELFQAIDRASLDATDNELQQYWKNNNNPFLAKVLAFCYAVLQQRETNGGGGLALRMLLVGAWFASAPVSVTLLAAAAKNMPEKETQLRKWTKFFGCCSGWENEQDSAAANVLVKLGLARRANRQQLGGGGGCWIQFHPLTQSYAKAKQGGSALAAKATVDGVRKMGNPVANGDHLWASAFLVFGFKSEPPAVQLKAIEMVMYIKKTALPLAVRSFTGFSRCNSALELLKVCTNVLEEVEKSFVTQIQDWCKGSLCWKKGNRQRVDEYVWEEVTLLKATLLETRAKLLMRGGHFDSAEELSRTCISIRMVMLGHNHPQTLAAQETLSKLVRMRSKI